MFAIRGIAKYHLAQMRTKSVDSTSEGELHEFSDTMRSVIPYEDVMVKRVQRPQSSTAV